MAALRGRGRRRFGHEHWLRLAKPAHRWHRGREWRPCGGRGGRRWVTGIGFVLPKRRPLCGRGRRRFGHGRWLRLAKTGPQLASRAGMAALRARLSAFWSRALASFGQNRTTAGIGGANGALRRAGGRRWVTGIGFVWPKNGPPLASGVRVATAAGEAVGVGSRALASFGIGGREWRPCGGRGRRRFGHGRWLRLAKTGPELASRAGMAALRARLSASWSRALASFGQNRTIAGIEGANGGPASGECPLLVTVEGGEAQPGGGGVGVVVAGRGWITAAA